MKRMLKYAAAAGVAGVLTIGMAAPSQAAHGRNAAAAIGFGAGALVGAAAANATNYGYYGGPEYTYGESTYGESYAYAPRRSYAPGYAYGPGYAAGDDAYAYEPAGPGWSGTGCATQGSYGQGLDYSACGGD